MRARPSLRHSSVSSRARCSSMAKWTARISSGVRLRAYCSARAVARLSWSTITKTTWRRRMGRPASSATSSFSSVSSSTYWRFMRTSSTTRTGTSTRMNQAPCRNLVARKMTSTMSDRTAPMPLTNTPFCQPFSFFLMWCFVMPAWLMVKLVNTPTA